MDLLSRARKLYSLPLFDLLFRAQDVHRENFEPSDIQRCALLSIKTGGCPEDCAYCPQSAHYDTGLAREGLVSLEKVSDAAAAAKRAGAERFCMGAAWREVKDGPEFDRVLEMVAVVKRHGLEACATLGLLNDAQARRLKDAGLDAYNHNVDTSREYYGRIITTREFEDRLATLRAVRRAGLSVCSGGIVGMGESPLDRLKMLVELASLAPAPESVPINCLIPIVGTPLAESAPIDPLELVRLIAVARLLMPLSRIRLSAGRTSLSREAQALAFLAGANSIFLGEKLLTRPNPPEHEDRALLQSLGPQEL